MLAAVCIAFALVLPMHSLEPFLLLLSSVFVPLYGVILGRLGTGSERRCRWARAASTCGAALIWIAGIAVYHACAKWAPQLGSALPTLAITFVLAWITRPAPAGGRVGTGAKPWLSGPWPAPTCTSAPAAMAAIT